MLKTILHSYMEMYILSLEKLWYFNLNKVIFQYDINVLICKAKIV